MQGPINKTKPECEVSPVIEPGGTTILSYVINRRYYHLIDNYVNNKDQQQQGQRSVADGMEWNHAGEREHYTPCSLMVNIRLLAYPLR